MTREQFQSVPKLPTETVPVPEFGDGASIVVKRLTAGEFVELVEAQNQNQAHALALWIVASAIDDEGKRLFTFEDAPGLMERDFNAIQRLADASIRLNGQGEGKKP